MKEDCLWDVLRRFESFCFLLHFHSLWEIHKEYEHFIQRRAVSSLPNDMTFPRVVRISMESGTSFVSKMLSFRHPDEDPEKWTHTKESLLRTQFVCIPLQWSVRILISDHRFLCNEKQTWSFWTMEVICLRIMCQKISRTSDIRYWNLVITSLDTKLSHTHS
jgi:hypothetical protein